MRDDRVLTRASKFLSLLLRHAPEKIGLELSPEGWATVSDLVRLSQKHSVVFTPELLKEIVRSDAKQRYALSLDGQRVRANQGHSLPVDLGLVAACPPPVLFHGTATRNVQSIMKDGLLRRRRQHVHLSQDVETALRVGRRHGKPVVLGVDALGMQAAGAEFFLSANGVWLTAGVPPRFLHLPEA